MPELTFCTSGAITSIAAPGQVNFARVSVSQYLSNAGPFGGGPRRAKRPDPRHSELTTTGRGYFFEGAGFEVLTKR
jgi:hypothetical protein